MILRLKSRLASGLIVATVALAGTTVASAADTTATAGANAAPGYNAAAPATSTPSAAPSAAPSTAPGAGDTNMAPRGNEATATPHATAGAAGAGDTQAKRIFDQLDLNHDGMLSLDEFSRATFQQPK